MDNNLKNQGYKPYDEVEESIELLNDILQPSSSAPGKSAVERTTEQKKTDLEDFAPMGEEVYQETKEEVYEPITEDIQPEIKDEEIPAPTPPVLADEESEISETSDDEIFEEATEYTVAAEDEDDDIVQDLSDQQDYIAESDRKPVSSFEDTAEKLDAEEYSPAYAKDADKTEDALEEKVVVEHTDPSEPEAYKAYAQDDTQLPMPEDDSIPEPFTDTAKFEVKEKEEHEPEETTEDEPDDSILIDMPETDISDEEDEEESYIIDQPEATLDSLKDSEYVEKEEEAKEGELEVVEPEEIQAPEDVDAEQQEYEVQQLEDAGTDNGYISDPYTASDTAYKDTNEFSEVDAVADAAPSMDIEEPPADEELKEDIPGEVQTEMEFHEPEPDEPDEQEEAAVESKVIEFTQKVSSVDEHEEEIAESAEDVEAPELPELNLPEPTVDDSAPSEETEASAPVSLPPMPDLDMDNLPAHKTAEPEEEFVPPTGKVMTDDDFAVSEDELPPMPPPEVAEVTPVAEHEDSREEESPSKAPEFAPDFESDREVEESPVEPSKTEDIPEAPPVAASLPESLDELPPPAPPEIDIPAPPAEEADEPEKASDPVPGGPPKLDIPGPPPSIAPVAEPVAETSKPEEDAITEDQEEALDEYEQMLKTAKQEAEDFISEHAPGAPAGDVPLSPESKTGFPSLKPDDKFSPSPDADFAPTTPPPPGDILKPPLPADEIPVKGPEEADKKIEDLKYKSVPLDSKDKSKDEDTEQSFKSFLSKFKKKKEQGEESE